METSPLIFDSRSTMSATTKLKLVHIPCDGSPITMKRIALIDIDPEESDKDNYQDLEKKLRHIPDVQSFRDFGWAHRTLAVLPKKNQGGGVEEWPEADYLLYVCMDERAGLDQNLRVQEILTAYGPGRGTQLAPIMAYGDAFVFAMEPRSKEVESEPAEYTHVFPSFVLSTTADYASAAVALIWKLLYYAAQEWQAKI